MNPKTRTVVLSLAVGAVLADSAVVTLALPDILARYHAEVGGVAWVLTAFNLALAIAAVPAAILAHRRHAGRACAAGLIVFAVASAACAAAPSLGTLIGARVVQAFGGAVVLGAALVLLTDITKDETRAVATWATAGVIGAAVGPVAGGLLTQGIAWEAIFVVQIPIALIALPACRGAGAATSEVGERRPAIAANLALAAISAALTAALFLLVLLLVEGWQRSPAVAALTVTVVPVAALGSGVLARRLSAGPLSEASGGAILLAGGLAALAIVPKASLAWTIPPQALIGLGLGLTVAALTGLSLRERVPQAVQGGWTIASRHAGVCIGLLLLTPVFTSDLKAERVKAEQAGTALLLDAQIAPGLKVDLASAVAKQLNGAEARLPDLRPAFAAQKPDPKDRAELDALESGLRDQVLRAATHSFQGAFLLAAVLALLGLLPIAVLALGKGSRPSVPAGSSP